MQPLPLTREVIIPLRVPYYRQSNSAPWGTVSVPFFLNVSYKNVVIYGQPKDNLTDIVIMQFANKWWVAAAGIKMNNKLLKLQCND